MTEKYIPSADGLEVRDQRSANTAQFAKIISANVTASEVATYYDAEVKQVAEQRVESAIWEAEAHCYSDDFFESDATTFKTRFLESFDDYMGNAEDEIGQLESFLEWCDEALEGRDLRKYFTHSMMNIQTGKDDRDLVKIDLLKTLDSSAAHSTSPQWYEVIERLLPGGVVNEDHHGFEDAGKWKDEEMFESGERLPGTHLFMVLGGHMKLLDLPYDQARALLAEQFYLAYSVGTEELTSMEARRARIDKICDMANLNKAQQAQLREAVKWFINDEREEEWAPSPTDITEDSLYSIVALSRIHQERFEQDHPFVGADMLPVEDCLMALRNFPSLVEHIEVGESERWGHKFDNHGRYQEAGGSDTYLLHADGNQTYLDPDTQRILTIRHFAEQPDRMVVSYEYQRTPEENLEYGDSGDGPAIRWSELEMTDEGVRMKTCIKGWEHNDEGEQEIVYETFINNPEDCQHLLQYMQAAPSRVRREWEHEANKKILNFLGSIGINVDTVGTYLDGLKN